MRAYLSTFWNLIGQLQWGDYVDILVLAVVIFQLIKLTRESRASQVLKGFAIIMIISVISQWLNLTGISQLISNLVNSGIVVLVVLFQPELRRGLERLGGGKMLLTRAYYGTAAEIEEMIDEIAQALLSMAKTKTGALIAIQRSNTLQPIIESGTIVEAKISRQLLENIFFKNSPLHDGGAILYGDRVVAAGCVFPLTGKMEVSQDLGTRHRAALGMSEHTDAVVLVVSEETGVISLAEAGVLKRNLDLHLLKKNLYEIYQPEAASQGLKALFRRKKNNEKAR